MANSKAIGVAYEDQRIVGGTVDNTPIGATTPSTGSFTSLAASGKLSGGGTTTNDSAAAGLIGEIITATVAAGSAVSLTTATAANVTSISLTAGDWDISAVVDRTLTGTTATQYACSVSLTTATMSSQAGGSGLGTDPAIVQSATFGTTVTGNYSQAIPPVRLSIAATTTVYLVASDTFSAGSVGAFGTIRARRVR